VAFVLGVPGGVEFRIGAASPGIASRAVKFMGYPMQSFVVIAVSMIWGSEEKHHSAAERSAYLQPV
jgi:hypothetical protein